MSTLLTLAVGLLLGTAATPPDSSGAHILVAHEGDAYTINGTFVDAELAYDNLEYFLTVEKKGKSGTSTSRQGGKVPERGAPLSTVRINAATGDEIVVKLTVLASDCIVGKDRRAWTVGAPD